jgi:hypothetical protein
MSLFPLVNDDMQPAPFDPDTGELFPEIVAPVLVIESEGPQPNPEPASERAAEKVAEPNPEPLGGRSLDEALFRAQAELPNWVKAEKVGARGKYAPLGMILAVVRPVFAAHGLRIRQGADRSWPMDEGGGSKGRLR